MADISARINDREFSRAWLAAPQRLAKALAPELRRSAAEQLASLARCGPAARPRQNGERGRAVVAVGGRRRRGERRGG
jgi:hypothetical protein